jgi:hypothetical protein
MVLRLAVGDLCLLLWTFRLPEKKTRPGATQGHIAKEGRSDPGQHWATFLPNIAGSLGNLERLQAQPLGCLAPCVFQVQTGRKEWLSPHHCKQQ